jgi:hypothetical protein
MRPVTMQPISCVSLKMCVTLEGSSSLSCGASVSDGKSWRGKPGAAGLDACGYVDASSLRQVAGDAAGRVSEPWHRALPDFAVCTSLAQLLSAKHDS